jgi:predicted nucleotidyltransferase
VEFTSRLRVYTNLSTTANTAPTAPTGVAGSWDYNASGLSTATFKWSPAVDSGTGATPDNVLTYQVQVSTRSDFTGDTVVAGQWATPGMGNYFKPPKIFDGNSKHGVMLHTLSQTNTTYYFKVKAVDAGLRESAWSDTASLYSLVASSVPSAVADLSTAAVSRDGQIRLTWTAPLNITAAGNAAFDLRYSTVSAITNDTQFNNATAVTGEPTPDGPGLPYSMALTNLTPGVTYYFAMKSSNDNGTGPLDVNSVEPSALPNDFDATQIDMGGGSAGLSSGDVAWGDFDNDGDLDVLASGQDSSNLSQVRTYINNGNGTMSPTPIEIDGLNGGIYGGVLAWGDYDNDGDLDILASGADVANAKQLRVYLNNANGTFDPNQIEVDGLNGGLYSASGGWGDFDNDGDLDILVNGLDSSSAKQFRVYKNNGNGTFDGAQIDVDGLGGGLYSGSPAWGDFDNDGDLDILVNGLDTSSGKQLRVYKNNGNATFDTTQIEVESLNGGLSGGTCAWGDFDADGDLDILGNGINSTAAQLRVYTNNGNGTFSATEIDIEATGDGLSSGDVAWGDVDNDGDLDVLASGQLSTTGTYRQLRVYKNNGNATFNPTQQEIEGLNIGLSGSAVAWGDFDIDGDLDILTNGTDGATKFLSIYKNMNQYVRANTAPSAPATLSSTWAYSATGISTATFKWVPAADNGVNPTPANGITYQVEISTLNTFTGRSIVPNGWASPGMGNYLKPPKIFDGNTTHGVMLHYLPLTNTTYYFRVKAIDAGLKESAWSSTGNLFTTVASSVPAAVTNLSTSTILGAGQVTLSWTAPLNINSAPNPVYDVRYSTTAAITNDSQFNTGTALSGEPTPGVPGASQNFVIASLTPMLTYYFGLKSSNDIGTSALDTISTRPYVVASFFDATQIEVDGVNNGLRSGDVAWGDYDSDGDLDILVSGYDSLSIAQLRIYKNNGAGGFDTAQIEIDGLNNGLYGNGVAWGDFDIDGDLDILVSGKDVLTLRQLRVYKNNGNGTIDPSQIEIEGTGNGIDNGKVAWGDYNNDGALDILANGTNNGSSGQLRVYNNNRNGTFDSTQIEVDSLNGGLYSGGVVWGDYDKDGDLDIMAGGLSGSGQLRVYANNGNGSFNDTQIEVDGAAGGLYNGTNQWGDFDNDGDLDILINGYNGNPQLRVYLNNGNGTFDVSQIEVDGLNNGLYNGSVAWGDHDNDGDIDILVSGYNANNRQLRVYGNNGNGTFSPTQIEVEGLGGGLEYSSDAWGDFDNDGDLDVLANGTDGSQYQLRVYKNLCVTANTSPSAPGTLSSSWAYDASGSSTATFKWTPASDNGTGATPDNGLSYQIEISTSSGFTGTSMVPGQWATPGMGNYLKPPKIFDGNTTHGVLLHSLAATNTTYYFRVKTIDSGLKESAWSATGSLYTLVASSAPFAVTNLVATSLADGAQVRLRWTAPFNIQSGSGPSYDIRYSAIGAISNDTDFDNATPLTGEPAPGFPGATEIALIENLPPLTTYYFAIKSSHSNGTSPLDSSSPRPNAYAYVFLTSLSIDGSLDGAMSFSGGTGWGDFDNDGDLDILAMGYDGYYSKNLRVYKNNGNGTIDYSQIDLPSAGLDDAVVWGDFDNDGDLDILANGTSSGTTAQLRVYKNNGNGTFNISPIEIDGAGGGLYLGTVEWGDFENDGDLDVLVCGNATGGATKELRIYKNNGNATFDANQIDVDGPGGGLNYASASWGDFDMEGDLDILIAGNDGTNRQLRIYKNNGNGTMDGTQIEVDGANNGLDDGAVAWGDTDNDGDLDILASGNNGSGQLRVYKNNGNATFDAVQIEVDGLNGGPNEGDCAWGDFDLDGDIDIALIGNRRIWVYKSNGNGTFDGNEIWVNALSDGLIQGGIAWGDYDSDGDPDLLVSGVDGNEEYKYLRIYKNNYSGNTSPTAPATASPGFTFSSTGVSIASFTWSAGSDSGTGATPENVLTYDVQISTTSDFSTLLFPGQLGASPRMGSYLKPPKIFNSNADYGIVLKSTDPWNTQSTANFGLRTDTTYYYRVKTIDAGLAESAWSAAGTLLSGAPPSTSTLNATTTLNEGEALLAWTSAGDDGMIGDLTGNYRIQYATYTAAWSAESTPTDATTVTISTATTVPGSDQTYLATSLPTGNTYYFVLWSQDDVNAWSTVSNTASAWLAGGSDPISPSTSTLAAASTATDDEVLLTWNSAGDDGMDGNLTGTYRLQYATYTATWSTESTPTDATTITISTTNAVPGSAISYKATGLTGGLTYYFVLWSGDEIPNWSDISNTTSAMSAYRFDPNPINVDGPGGGLYTGSVAWGDFDNDGYLDALASGYTGSTVELRIYKNNGNGTMDATQINVDGAGGGVFYSGATWGDYDNDGDLDVLASGKQNSGSTLELRIYKNNGNGTINQAQIEVDGAAGGLWQSNVSWGDYDNDGDMDIVVGGERSDNVTRELRLYKNNGNGTIDPIQIEIAGAGNGMGYGFGGLGWGDFDNDGDIDILASGYATGNSVELRIYRNNGNGSIDPVPIEVDGTGNGLRDGGVAWGDFDNDGDSDILVSGYGSSRQLRIYKNNGNGTMDATQIEVDGAGGGLRYGGVAWGDFDNDGDIDILANGNQTSGSTRELRVYSNNGNGTINLEQLEVAGTGLGLYYGGVGWGDFDDDNDLDILVSGEQTSGSSKELRIYKNRIMTSNIAPTAPATLTGGFSFNASAVSVASMTWNAGTDSGTGATPENVLTYDLQISTVSNFNSVIFPGQMGASPRMGSYLKPPKIFNSNTYYGVVLKSTDPWNAQATASYGLRTDTTYYYRVKTVDSALEESSWSSGGSAYSGVSPSTSTLAAAAGTSQASLSWTSAGDDGMNGNLTGQYRIQYATYTATWSTSSTPANATTVTLATTTQSPGSAQGYTATGLTGGLTYYFVLWSGDEVPNWSTISNTTNTVPAAPVTVTLAEAVGQPGWIGQGETQRILGTAQAVSDSASGVTVSSVSVNETGSYTADGNLTNVEVWVSSSGHIDASAIRLENTAKAFSSDAAVFTQNVTVSTTPLYFIARADVSGSATEGTFDLSLQVYTTALTANNPIAFTNATDVVAPPSGAPSGLTATASGNLLRVSLSWGASAGADTYSVYRATYSGVTTTDFLLGITNATSFNDDYIPPQQQMYYTVLATNRAGASGAGSAANATSVDVWAARGTASAGPGRRSTRWRARRLAWGRRRAARRRRRGTSASA